MVAATSTSFCVPSSIALLLNAVFAAALIYFMWDYFKRYYEVVGKLQPDVRGIQLFLTPMMRPFLIYSKAARALPEYRSMWRSVLFLLASFFPIALFNAAMVDYACP